MMENFGGQFYIRDENTNLEKSFIVYDKDESTSIKRRGLC